LSNADLKGAVLSATRLGDDKHGDADLSGAILSNANLNGAVGWTGEQLRAAKSLEGATMPDGRILKSDDKPDRPTFEEWLKSRGEKG